ncbi:hypothetical protein [Aneurinibacillus tyrosinisolvens]|uniref:hypothetical protein n=1 Tax=Aneurinibacillus tyrosinisolvens TaxID=1443435 RepID=UPI00063F45F7|nr:hypothetical protein [Aneurinibacillus tyrosinisolvens]
MGELELEMGIELFKYYGHAFWPDREDGIGEVTRLLIKGRRGYVKCSTDAFYRGLCKALSTTPALLRKYSYKILHQRRLAPVVLRINMLLIPFPCVFSTNPAHRYMYARFSSIKECNYYPASRMGKLIFEDGHTIDLQHSIKFLIRQQYQARVLLLHYTNPTGF